MQIIAAVMPNPFPTQKSYLMPFNPAQMGTNYCYKHHGTPAIK